MKLEVKDFKVITLSSVFISYYHSLLIISLNFATERLKASFQKFTDIKGLKYEVSSNYTQVL